MHNTISQWLGILTLAFLWSATTLNGQQKSITTDDFATWNRIADVRISDDGSYASYQLRADHDNDTIILYDISQSAEMRLARGTQGGFSGGSNYFSYMRVAEMNYLREQKRAGKKKKELPKDTLVLITLSNAETIEVPAVKSYEIPENYPGYLAYTQDTKADDSLYVKSEDSDNGFHLYLDHLSSDSKDTFPFVLDFAFAEDSAAMMYHTSGDDSLILPGIYLEDLSSGTSKMIYQGDVKLYQWTISEDASQIALVLDSDTTKALQRPYELHYWSHDQGASTIILDRKSVWLPAGHTISPDRSLNFTEDGMGLYFGIRPHPLLQDTSLLDEEIVQVEIWNYKDPLLYTQQKVNASDEKKRSYLCAYDIEDHAFVQLESEEIPRVYLTDKSLSEVYVGVSNLPYQQDISWIGKTQNDVYLINSKTGANEMIYQRLNGRPQLSPHRQYIYWYDDEADAWTSYHLSTGTEYVVANSELSTWTDELNDRPMDPRAYGSPGWINDDDKIWLYDRYDIWVADPAGDTPVRLTRGRESQLRYRHISTDSEADTIDTRRAQLLSVMDMQSKQSGYAWLMPDGTLTEHLGSYQLGRRIYKAQDAEVYLHTRESMDRFPDLLLSGPDLDAHRQISDANPQLSQYAWGSVRLHEWTSSDGEVMQGLLYLPPDWSAEKSYPLLVNFYERNSDGLYRHRSPQAHRSTINYPLYLSDGYVIFNPDVSYHIGYPGRSSEEDVLSGIESVIDVASIDRARIGVQGHSWGGYQVAHLLTRTDIFACAESGAPVVNMTSAYGGIRWGSGMSRMFQYEKTQSRIGATLWEDRELYLENSPLFYLDKMNTPVLILHNDADGAVPWYQGIEYFVGLRRLGKPAWMLNYNDEPHWPLKWQNRLDFQIRMKQFFDHYLKGAEMPRWMQDGIPAIHQGIDRGYDE